MTGEPIHNNLMRIQKYLSARGICSRRKAEEFVQNGWVRVNGQIIKEPGLKINPDTDHIELLPQAQSERQAMRCIAFHKPRGVVTNLPHPGETEIRNLLPRQLSELHPVGRLDKESEGLILLTDDGILARNILQSIPPHEREYHVWIDGTLTDEMKHKIETGLPMMGTTTLPCTVKRLGANQFSITLTEGKNRQIRRMCQKVGVEVIRLKRIRIGTIMLGDITPRNYRNLDTAELQQFYKSSSPRI